MKPALPWLLPWLLIPVSAAGLDLERVELNVPGRVTHCQPADVDGDGTQELLIFWRQGMPPHAIGRLSLYGAEGGRFSRAPRQVLSLPAGTVAFEVGDADADGRADVLLLMGDGVWALAAGADGRLAEQPVRLVEVLTLAAFPHEDRVPPIGMLVDLGGPLGRGLLLPAVPIGPLLLYQRGADGHWRQRAQLRVPTRAEVYTGAEDLRAGRDFWATFRYSFPSWAAADTDGDYRRELLFFSRDALALFSARPDGSWPRDPDQWRSFGLLSDEERLRRAVYVRAEAADVNGDGRADLMFNKAAGGIANMSSEVRLYLARSDGSYAATPDWQVVSPGYGASARLVDTDGDGRADLVRPHVPMGIANLTRMMLSGKLSVTFQVFRTRADTGLPGPAPDAELESSLGINFRSDQEMTGPYPLLDWDFNGDSRPDALLGEAGGGSGSERPDRLEVRPGDGRGGWGEAIWELDLPGTQVVLPWRPRTGGPAGLVIAFPQVERLRGDVWVFWPLTGTGG